MNAMNAQFYDGSELAVSGCWCSVKCDKVQLKQAMSTPNEAE